MNEWTDGGQTAGGQGRSRRTRKHGQSSAWWLDIYLGILFVSFPLYLYLSVRWMGNICSVYNTIFSMYIVQYIDDGMAHITVVCLFSIYYSYATDAWIIKWSLIDKIWIHWKLPSTKDTQPQTRTYTRIGTNDSHRKTNSTYP